MIKGNLASFSLGEIFQSLAVNTHTGTMKILEKTGEEKYLYFSKGEICLFSSSSHPSLRIGEILIRSGALERSKLEEALELQKTSSERLGGILIKHFGVSQSDIEIALETKICEEIYDLFLLNEAEFEFFVDHFPEEIFESYEKNIHISINTTNVLMEGLRLADEWKVIQRKVGTFNEIFALTGPPPAEGYSCVEEEAVYTLIDGQTPVSEIFDYFPGSRFECCKTLFEFLGAGRIRPLSLEECRQKGNEASKKGDTQSAIFFLNYATQLGPDRPEPFVLVGKLLKQIDKEHEAQAAHLKATQLYFEAGDFKKVIEVGDPLLKSHPRDEELLTAVFQAAMAEKKKEIASNSGECLAQILLDKGSRAHAIEILQRLIGLFPSDLMRRLYVAGLLKEGNNSQDQDRAIHLLEEGLDLVGSKGDINEKIKVNRLLFEICPDRQDVKQEISNLLSLQERVIKRKKAKVTLFGIVCIVLLLLALIPILYEIKARELYSHAQRLEQISKETGNYQVAVDAYTRLIDEYSMSTRASMAEASRDSLVQREKTKAEVIQKVENTKKFEQAQKFKKAKQNVVSKFERAAEFESKGKFPQAFALYKELLNADRNLFPQEVETILLPVIVTSNPPGCNVTLNKKVVGKTPIVLRAEIDKPLELHLSRDGCEPHNLKSKFGEKASYHFEMKLRPITDFRLSSAIHDPIDSDGEDLVFPSRDGFFYSFSPKNQKLNWRRVIGRFGDKASTPLYLPTEIVIGNVNGEVSCFSRENGKSRWRLFLEHSILARPSVSEDARYVAVGDTSGKLSLIDNKSGKLTGQFQTENEILFAPAFWNYMAIVASEDNNLYFVSLPKAKKVIHTESFPGEISCDLQVYGQTMIFTTRDGQLHSYDLSQRRFKWTRNLEGEPVGNPIQYQDQFLTSLASGEIVAIESESGVIKWKQSLCKSLPGQITLNADKIYMGTQEGEVFGFDLKSKTKIWSYRSDSVISQAPLVFGHHLFVVTHGGKFFIMELFKG